MSCGRNKKCLIDNDKCIQKDYKNKIYIYFFNIYFNPGITGIKNKIYYIEESC